MPQFEVLFCDHTELGLVCLRRRELLSQPGVRVTEMTLDHELVMSSYITDSERALARRALELCDRASLSVLVGGLGFGYTAHEALASSRVARVEVLEYLPEVIQWLESGLVPLAGELNASPRISVHRADVYARLLAPPTTRYDLILVDVDHSPDEHLGSGSATFYTADGLRRAKEHLTPGGVLGVWSYAEHSGFSGAMHQVFEQVSVEPVTVFNDLVDEEQTDWLFFGRAT